MPREKMFLIQVGRPWCEFWYGSRTEGPVRVARASARERCIRGCDGHQPGEFLYPDVRIKQGRTIVAAWHHGKRIK